MNSDSAVRRLQIDPCALRVRTILDVIFCSWVYHDYRSGIAQGTPLNWFRGVELSAEDKSDSSLVQAKADW